MREDLQNRLFADHPAVLTHETGGRTRRVFSEHGAGWYAIVDGLCEVLEARAAAEGRAPAVAQQIKEKMGDLRVYLTPTDRFDAMASWLAGAFSNRVCELCGAPGRPHTAQGWLCTLCPSHAADRAATPQDIATWVRPRILPLGFATESLRSAHAGVLAPNANLWIHDGWLDLLDCALDLLGNRNADAIKRGNSDAVAYRVRSVVVASGRMVIDIDSHDAEASGVAAFAEAMSRRIDTRSGALLEPTQRWKGSHTSPKTGAADVTTSEEKIGLAVADAGNVPKESATAENAIFTAHIAQVVRTIQEIFGRTDDEFSLSGLLKRYERQDAAVRDFVLHDEPFTLAVRLLGLSDRPEIWRPLLPAYEAMCNGRKESGEAR